MDLVNILPALEGIASSINFGPLNDLLAKIRQFVERILLFITPDAPVRDAGLAMAGYADAVGTHITRLGNSLPTLRDKYSGPAADQYYASAEQALQLLQKLQVHLNSGVDRHAQLAEHFAEALLQQGMLVAQGAIMAVDLGSLIFTGGLDAPVSVPVAAGDAVAADGTVIAMDAAVDAADTAVSAIGESASEIGDMAFDLGDEGAGTLADGDPLADEPLGGRGPGGDGDTVGNYSGRPFNPDESGGPIQDPPLNPQDATITEDGIQQIEQHLSRFGDDPANNAMISRLRQIVNGEIEPSPYDYNFYTHELDEFGRYTNLGYETGVPSDMDAADALWNNTHTAALEDYGLRDWIPDGSGGRLYQLYDPSVWDLLW